jgi:hypothetical protein
MCKSSKQEHSTKSSTEAELVDAKQLLEVQRYTLKENIFTRITKVPSGSKRTDEGNVDLTQDSLI